MSCSSLRNIRYRNPTKKSIPESTKIYETLEHLTGFAANIETALPAMVGSLWDDAKTTWTEGRPEDKVRFCSYAATEVASWFIGVGEIRSAAKNADDMVRQVKRFGKTGTNWTDNVIKSIKKVSYHDLSRMVREGLNEAGEKLSRAVDDLITPQRELAMPGGGSMSMSQADDILGGTKPPRSGGGSGSGVEIGGAKPKEHINDIAESAGKVSPSLPKDHERIPKGKHEVPDIKDPRPIMRQNDTANLLASEGYDIEMLPNKKGGNGYGIKKTSNPDFLIENEVFDCYSPNTDNARNIRSTILSKTEKQASNVILNLDDCPVSIDDILKAIENEPIQTLDKLMYVKDGKITQVLPN